jgi:ABC-type uncharacterized transport system ATPase subunit
MDDLVLEVERIEKSFGAVRALAGLDLAVQTGTIVGCSARTAQARRRSCGSLATLIEPTAGRAQRPLDRAAPSFTQPRS